MKQINYIAEINLPSTSAYSIHVMKMCNAFSKAGFKTVLYVYSKNKNLNLFKFYGCKYQFLIKNLSLLNFNSSVLRILFAIKIFLIFLFKNKSDLIISRSILSSIILTLISKNVILEVHHELKSFTKLLFYFFYKFKFFRKNIKLIFISKNLSKKYNLKGIKFTILDDCVDLDNFNFRKKNIKKYKKTCVYTGSFSSGKGVEKIIKIAKICPKINFHLYGDLINSSKIIEEVHKIKNIKYKGFLPYKDVPKTLFRYELLLLPYSKKVYVRSKNIEVGKYMSPLKLFDYLASKKIILATNLNVYNHLLNKNNSILFNSKSSLNKWALKIEQIFANLKKYQLLKKKSYQTVLKYTWDLRIKKILKLVDF